MKNVVITRLTRINISIVQLYVTFEDNNKHHYYCYDNHATIGSNKFFGLLKKLETTELYANLLEGLENGIPASIEFGSTDIVKIALDQNFLTTLEVMTS